MGGYHPTIDQRELIANFDRPLAALLPVARLHQSAAGETGERWTGIAELGLLGLGVAESAGGIGLGATEEVLMVERLGRHLASPSLIATIVAGHIDDPALVAQFAAGRVRVAAAWSRDDGLCLLDHEAAAYALLLDPSGGLLLIDTVVPVDGRLWAVALCRASAGVPVAHLGAAGTMRGRLLVAAALCGIAGTAAEMSVAYAAMREQFGRPIGAFQAVKHHCADMALAARAALDLATFAAVAIDNERPDAAFQAEAALVLAINAALANARRNVQVHGGIGFSDEADPHLLVKRAHALVAMAGGSDAAIARLAALPSAI